MAGRMSNADRAMLKEMWLCGVGMQDIADAMRRPARTVELRIQATGMQARPGTGTMRRSTPDRVRAGIEALLPDLAAACSEEVARVLLAMVAYGRRSPRIADVSGVDPARASLVMQAFHDTGTWPVVSGPPVRWWTDGMTAVHADLATIDAIVGGTHAA